MARWISGLFLSVLLAVPAGAEMRVPQSRDEIRTGFVPVPGMVLEPGRAGLRAGLRPGDILRGINGVAVKSAGMVESMPAASGRWFRL
ncbi:MULTISPECIES: hypothetical protein [unclassified Roseovarius]|uniref:hypothetical protein n=1 Tax=unclassified Roseovarius TaxID=2614913 RepID=UPI00273F1ACA|nr:hypothetical protein [Roseovarius sp. MMSF_3350]